MARLYLVYATQCQKCGGPRQYLAAALFSKDDQRKAVEALKAHPCVRSTRTVDFAGAPAQCWFAPPPFTIN